MSIQMAIGILVQTLYFFTDLYFVSKLGDAAIAGVTSAGNIWFVVLALTQILNVGTVALVSHAVGAQQRDRANLVFNQSLSLSVFMGAAGLRRRVPGVRPYMRTVAADEATARAGIDYLYWLRRAWRCSSRWSRCSRRCAPPACEADHDPAGDQRAGEHRARAGAHRRAGARASHGRGRRGPGEHASLRWSA